MRYINSLQMDLRKTVGGIAHMYCLRWRVCHPHSQKSLGAKIVCTTEVLILTALLNGQNVMMIFVVMQKGEPMTNGEAINWIINISADIGKAEHRDLWHYEQALSEIKEMLETAQPNLQPTCKQLATDCISRQAAIDALCKACSIEGDYHKCDGYPETSTWCDYLVSLRALPSAQTEIIKCEDCRWGREVCGNIECFVDSNIPPEYHGYEWFCPNGERRIDE